jgi:hypothetical protein
MLSGCFGEPVQQNGRRNLPDVVSARQDGYPPHGSAVHGYLPSLNNNPLSGLIYYMLYRFALDSQYAMA